MKTNGSSHARAKKGIALSILALITTVPVFSQIDYASMKGTSFSGLETNSMAGSQDYYAVIKPFARQTHSAPLVGFISSPAKYAPKTEESKIIYTDLKDSKNSLLPALTDISSNIKNLEIRFKPTSFTYPQTSRVDVGIGQYPAGQLLLYANVLKQYAKKNGFDTSYAFLSNMGMLCNRKRFFVINLVTMEIEQSALVSHGRGQGASVFDKQYSNQSGSRCTSLGRYKILGKYKGSYGEAYKMAGLDSSNQNAYSRNIVLHSMGCIPDTEGIMPACVSEGCPAVSTKFLSSLSKIIDSRKKPVLLWIFDSNLEEAVVEEKPVKDKSPSDFADLAKRHNCSLHSEDKLVLR